MNYRVAIADFAIWLGEQSLLLNPTLAEQVREDCRPYVAVLEHPYRDQEFPDSRIDFHFRFEQRDLNVDIFKATGPRWISKGIGITVTAIRQIDNKKKKIRVICYMWFAEEFYHGLIKALTKLSNNEAKSSEKPKTTRERGPNSETLTNVEATLRDFIEGTAAKWTYACNLNGVDPKTVKRWARMVSGNKKKIEMRPNDGNNS